MMTIQLEFRGPVRRPFKELERSWEIPFDSTVENLLDSLQFKEKERRYLQISVNGMRADGEQLLQESDQVTITLIVGGG